MTQSDKPQAPRRSLLSGSGLWNAFKNFAILFSFITNFVLVIVLLSLFLALSGGAGGSLSVLVVLARMALYLAGAVAVGWFILPPLMRWVDRQPISEGLAALVMAIVLLFAWAAEVVGGLAAITGSFLAGVGVSRSHLRDKTEAKIRTITYAFFVPVFFVSIGLQANARALTGSAWLFLLAFFFVAVVSKVLGSGLGARLGGFNSAQALRVGVGMISRGEVGLIVAAVGVGQGLIDAELFSAVVVLVLLTTLTTPVMLRQVFPRSVTASVPQPAGAEES